MRHFMGFNTVKLSPETLKMALSTWLNDGQYGADEKLVIRQVAHNRDGSVTVTFGPAVRVAKVVPVKDTSNG